MHQNGACNLPASEGLSSYYYFRDASSDVSASKANIQNPHIRQERAEI
jgi:hypothetical protein